MRLPENFPIAQPGDDVDYTIDLTKYIAPETEISHVTWSLAVGKTLINSERDQDPGARLGGSPAIDGKTTTQRIAHLVAGNDYLVSIKADLRDTAQGLVLWTLLPCRDIGAG